MRFVDEVVWALIGVLLVTVAVEQVGVQALEIGHRARAVQPGEVVVLEVRPSEPVVTVRATAFGATVNFFSSAPDGVWLGLVGVDLEARSGEYVVAVRAMTGSGDTVRAAYTLTIEAKEFPTRHLSVNPSFVNPPADELARIQRETVLQAKIFRTVTASRRWRGGFLRPVTGEATSSFGRRSVYNGEPRSPHSGTDFRSPEGAPIKAPNAGTVVLADELYFSGNVVIIDHGWGLYSYFAHLSEIDVVEGELVDAGRVVGRVGATGRVTGPHLHWTVRLNEARVDPVSLMTLFPPETGG